MFVQDTEIVCVWVNVCVMAFHSGQRWRVGEHECPMWPSMMWIVASTSQGVPDEAKRGADREVRQQVMKERCEEDEEGCVYALLVFVFVCLCLWTHPVRWPMALAGAGGQECAVCGWDPPLSAPACPPSPHTSRLFILHCGKITAPALSSGSCHVYTLHPHPHRHTYKTPPCFSNSLSYKQLKVNM